jgi:DNA-binding helix-hairpin-helix protein with protein kinase domain
MPSPTPSGANSKMAFSKKLLPVFTLVVSMWAFSAQAHNVKHDEVMQPTAKSWVTNFGFLPIDVSHCTDIQTGFWPRPLDCKR